MEKDILDILTKVEQFGSVYTTLDHIISTLSKNYRSLNMDTFFLHLTSLLKSNTLYIEKRFGVPHRVYKYETFTSENQCSSILLERSTNILNTIGDLEELKASYLLKIDAVVDGENQLELTDLQKQAVLNGLIQPVSIITGYPGTGKTTCLKMLCRILKDSQIKSLLLAPTGIAAKRLTDLTGQKAFTVHRAFQAQGDIDNKDNAYIGVQSSQNSDSESSWVWGMEGSHHPAEVVIIDECSMLDINLLYRVLAYTNPKCRVVMIGDHEQLPSVGPGSVLKDVINSGTFPVTKFQEIFRQSTSSPIIVSAHDIVRGRYPTSFGPGFSMTEVSDEDSILEFLLNVVHEMYKKKINFQVFSPKHAGTLGVTNLNSSIRERLNPPSKAKKEYEVDRFSYVREGDRIMVIRNHYQKNICNGDFGKVHSINFSKSTITVKIFGDISDSTPSRYVVYPIRQFSQYFRLCYACTVHKAQGLEMDSIILPIVDSHGVMLQRNLLYTAVTRAKKNVVLIGQQSALLKSVQNNREDSRNTSLRDMLSIPKEV